MVKRLSNFFIITLLLATISSHVQAANLQSDVFFIPEQSFLRVNTRIQVTPTNNQFVLRLFPKAEVTAVSVTNLADYSIDRTNDATFVTVQIDHTNIDVQSYTLEISYEGFLNTDGHFFDRESLWFPELENIASDYEIRITTPREITPTVNGQLIKSSISTFASHTWLLTADAYPTVRFTYQGDDEGISSPVDESPVELEEHSEPEITQPEIPTIPESEVVVEPEFEPQLPVPSTDPLPIAEDRFLSPEQRLFKTIEDFEYALLVHDRKALEGIISLEFTNREKFIKYLENTPDWFHTPETTIDFIEIDTSLAEIQGTIVASKNINFNFDSEWVFQDEAWYLTEYNMFPASHVMLYPQLNPEHEQVFNWTTEFQAAVSNLDLYWLDYHLAMPLTDKQTAVIILREIGSIWHTVSYAPQASEIVIIVHNQEKDNSLKLYLTINPNQNTWQITDLDVVPLY